METVNKIRHLLDCPVCYDKLEPPIQTCEYGHGVCGNCRKSLKICGLCKKSFNHNPNTLLNQIVGVIPTKCRFHLAGCSEIFSTADVKNHEKICRYREVKCCFCKEDVSMKKLNEHIQRQHHKYELHTKYWPSFQRIYLQPGDNKYHRAVIYPKNIKTYFIFRSFLQNKVLHFGVQYAGKNQEKASNYKFDVRVHQRPPTTDDSFIQRSGTCVPYTFYANEILDQKNAIDSRLNLKEIFKTDDYLTSGLLVEIRIKKKSAEPKKLGFFGKLRNFFRGFVNKIRPRKE